MLSNMHFWLRRGLGGPMQISALSDVCELGF